MMWGCGSGGRDRVNVNHQVQFWGCVAVGVDGCVGDGHGECVPVWPRGRLDVWGEHRGCVLWPWG